jgi:hypothetical protein
VDDACRVGGVQALEHLTENRSCLCRREAASVLDPAGERLAFQELHDDEVITVSQLPDIEHFEDVIVADAPRCLRFALEALHHLFVAGVGGVQDLDRDLAIDAYVLTQVHGPHTALANHFDDSVLPIDHLAGF